MDATFGWWSQGFCYLVLLLTFSHARLIAGFLLLDSGLLRVLPTDSPLSEPTEDLLDDAWLDKLPTTQHH